MSQHSTTLVTTETHNLVKYSRSYGPGTDNNANEWQHFLNPVLKVVLDVKKSPKGELTSVRLRILWLMDDGNVSMSVDQREVVFEDIELVSFSSLLSNHAQPIRNSQGLPLKAVYRDSVVGIRYLHPIIVPPNSSPIYRRFQITFESNSAALLFIGAIQHVCPCKLHEQPGNGRTSTMAPSLNLQNQSSRQPISQTATSAHTSSLAHAPDPPASMHHSAMQTAFTPSAVRSSPLKMGFSSSPGLPSFQSPNVSTPLNMSSSPLSSSLPQHHKSTNIPATTHPVSADSDEVLTVNREGWKSNPRVGQANSSNLSLPGSSEPSFNTDSSSMPPPPIPSHNTQSLAQKASSTSAAIPGGPEHGLLESLRETSTLYNLSRTDLETLVSRVVREEGFVELLENLDSMWRVKGFLDR